MNRLYVAAVLSLLLSGIGCGADNASKPSSASTDSGEGASSLLETCLPTPVLPGTCGSAPVARASLIPGPGDPGFDAELDAKARRIDRVFHAFHVRGTGLNADLSVVDTPEARSLITQWVEEDDGWDFEAWSGVATTDVVDNWAKVAGAYGGVGVAADAYRYGALRDEGAACSEVAVAREQLLRSLSGLHVAVAITGTPGVIARGFASRDNPGYGQVVETTPLFDDAGNPLPEEKNNGTWREDVSGDYPNLVWEDSCSRDMLVGWAAGFGAAWEVIRSDPDIPDSVRSTLATDAAAIAASLSTVQSSGYDLEIMDADGRMTYHGLLHENSVDRYYVDTFENGPNALMALGIVGALAIAAEDETALSYVLDTLGDTRELPRIAEESAEIIDFGPGSNFSGYNMGFLGGWLSQRFVCDDAVRAQVVAGVDQGMYERPGEERQPAEQSQALYHLVALQARSSTSLWSGDGVVDDAVLDRVLADLRGFSDAPYFPESRVNCDEVEIEAGVCTALDGSTLHLLGEAGWNDTLIAEEPLPMSIRPASNYHWRSNPYQVNGDAGATAFLGAVDFRFVYWMGRFIER
ncbi:MAG: hypothetical protein CL927_06935 [Deltaproteobacteria bacterium]|nr:hypothetical protein [Deltaproteobacteria bacterium]HCH67002.1 hypothetical protein [Deltaproteobacteria bacterium]